MLQQMQNKQRQTLMDNYDYVMFGRIFKYEDTPSGASNQVETSSKTVISCHESIPDPPCYKCGHPGTSWGQTGALVTVCCSESILLQGHSDAKGTDTGHYGHCCDGCHCALSALCCHTT